MRTNINISLSEELKARMDRIDGVNWSEVARDAFELRLAELKTRAEDATMDDVITRLRATQKQSDKEDEAEGKELGRNWTKTTATVKELERLQEWADVKWNNHVLPSAYGELGELYMSVSGWDVDKDGRPDAAADEWWANDVGGRADPSDATIDGFMQGALEIWHEVRSQL